ncbi:head-tail joining protein [Methylobacterium oryzisoli]|uniref:head-tail joining protein n=1 Tax=Methylobacterium oryzisoli TaxID=3385502 RepID=UPI0038913910
MGLDFSTLVLGPNQDIFGTRAVLTPVRSAPGMAPVSIRGIFRLTPADYTNEMGEVTRMDNYTFDVRVTELPVSVTRGDKLSNIDSNEIPFLKDLVFTIEDTGDDGFGAQSWVIKAENIRGGRL